MSASSLPRRSPTPITHRKSASLALSTLFNLVYPLRTIMFVVIGKPHPEYNSREMPGPWRQITSSSWPCYRGNSRADLRRRGRQSLSLSPHEKEYRINRHSRTPVTIGRRTIQQISPSMKQVRTSHSPSGATTPLFWSMLLPHRTCSGGRCNPEISQITFSRISTMPASNCSDVPNSRPELFAKPFVSRFIGEPRMPRHEIRKGFDLTRRFHDTQTGYRRSYLCQSARHSENQISLCDGKDCGHKEWQCKRCVPLDLVDSPQTVGQVARSMIHLYFEVAHIPFNGDFVGPPHYPQSTTDELLRRSTGTGPSGRTAPTAPVSTWSNSGGPRVAPSRCSLNTRRT
jgi:hypothetical protein